MYRHHASEVICVDRAIWLHIPLVSDSLVMPIWIQPCSFNKLMFAIEPNGSKMTSSYCDITPPAWWGGLSVAGKYSAFLHFVCIIMCIALVSYLSQCLIGLICINIIFKVCLAGYSNWSLFERLNVQYHCNNNTVINTMLNISHDFILKMMVIHLSSNEFNSNVINIFWR